MEWMKIDQVAKRSGLTKRTIRFYEEIGLLSAPKRTEGGVRLYSEDDMEELEKVMPGQRSAWLFFTRASVVYGNRKTA